jgi:hypothetical protein
MRGAFGKHLIRGPDHDVIKARDGRTTFVARLDPDRVKELWLHNAIFREEWGDHLLRAC